MQWVIDAWCGYGNRKNRVIHTKPERKIAKKETFRMYHCVTCNCVWETDRASPQYIHKYQDFPKRGIDKKECKYCDKSE